MIRGKKRGTFALVGPEFIGKSFEQMLLFAEHDGWINQGERHQQQGCRNLVRSS